MSFSSVMRLFLAIACSRAFDSRYMTICLAFGGVGDHLEVIADIGQRIETEHFDRRRGFRLSNLRRPRSSYMARTLPNT